VALDPPHRGRRVVTCTGRAAIGAAYVGMTGSGASAELWFTTHQALPDAVTTLHRVRLSGGAPQAVLAYTGRIDEAAIAPDAHAVAYVNRTGLRLRDLTTQADRLLQRHELYCPATHRDCFMNSAPVWSVDGRYVAYLEYHGEAGGTTQVIEVATVPSVKNEVVTGGLTPVAWSPDGSVLCGLGGNGHFDGGFFSMPQGRPHALVIPGVGAPKRPTEAFSMSACTWAPDGRVVVSYAQRFALDQGHEFVAFLSRDLRLERLVETPGEPRGWTADGRAVVLVEQGFGRPAQYSLLYTDGSVVALELEAEAVLAVIPH
jgi:hypothetical protein